MKFRYSSPMAIRNRGYETVKLPSASHRRYDQELSRFPGERPHYHHSMRACVRRYVTSIAEGVLIVVLLFFALAMVGLMAS